MKKEQLEKTIEQLRSQIKIISVTGKEEIKREYSSLVADINSKYKIKRLKLDDDYRSSIGDLETKKEAFLQEANNFLNLKLEELEEEISRQVELAEELQKTEVELKIQIGKEEKRDIQKQVDKKVAIKPRIKF